MRDVRTAREGGKWRPWALWLPCVLAFLWSGLLALFDFVSARLSNYNPPPPPGQAWLNVGFIGQGMLAAACIVLLVAGLRRPSWRKAAAIT